MNAYTITHRVKSTKKNFMILSMTHCNTFKQNVLGISLNARLIAMRESAEKIIAKRAKEEEIALQDLDNRQEIDF